MKLLSIVCACAVTAFLSLSACTKPAASPSARDTDNQGHSQDDEHHPADDSHAMGHHGPSVALGTTDIGGLTVRAARDEAHLHAGDEAAIDVWVENDHESVIAVRFWVGTEDAKGSLKAKAEIENLDMPNHWHTHAVIPNPMPEGTKLWVEIETASGKSTGSYDMQLEHAH